MKYFIAVLLLINASKAIAVSEQIETFHGHIQSGSYDHIKNAWPEARRVLFNTVNNSCYYWEQTSKISYSTSEVKECIKEHCTKWKNGVCTGSWACSQYGNYHRLTAQAEFFCKME